MTVREICDLTAKISPNGELEALYSQFNKIIMTPRLKDYSWDFGFFWEDTLPILAEQLSKEDT